MHVIASTLLAGLALFTSPIAVPIGEYREVGKTSNAIVQLDTKNVIVKSSDAGTLVGAVVKLVLLTPKRETTYFINSVVFSCSAELAVVTRSESYDARGELIGAIEEPSSSKWIRGSDSAVNVIMSELCKDVTPKKFGGF